MPRINQESMIYMSIRLKKRHRLRKKEIKSLSEGLFNVFSISSILEADTVDMASTLKFDVVLVNGEILGLVYKKIPFFTVKGLLKFRPQKKYVTVDMGAVKFVYNGADIMAPGITDADSEIQSGDLVWIRDEKNLQPLAVGEAILSGEEMIQSNSGKAIISIHHVGDDLWNYES
jgi:PUA domain protein